MLLARFCPLSSAAQKAAIFLYLLNIRKLKIVKLLTHENHNITDPFPARLRQSAG